MSLPNTTDSDLKRIGRERERVDFLHIVEGVHPCKIWQIPRHHVMSQIPVMKVQTSETKPSLTFT